MSSTTTTQYYGLTQYIGTDKPDFADNNQAFRNVDADLHQVVQDSQGFTSDIANLTERVGNLDTDLTNLSTDLDGEKAKIVALQNKELSQDTEIARVERNAQDMITAYNEASATSTHAYAVGDYFIYNNVLYQATAAIAVGATIVPDTNCTTTNVASELIQLNTSLVPLPPITVIGNGVKTYEAVLNEIYAQIDKTKIRATSNLVIKATINTSFLIVGAFTDSLISAQGSANNNAINYATLKASGSTYFQTIIGNTQSTNEYSSVALGAGESMTFNY